MRNPPLPTSQLAAAADAAVSKVLSYCAGPPLFGEVDTVAQIVTHGTSAIAAAWVPLLAAHGCKFSLAGVFCHQHPQVSFKHAHSPVEIADLLLVIDYHHGAGSTRRAALVQAKIDKRGAVSIRQGKQQAQLALFCGWPSFIFCTSGYDPRSRDFGTEVTSNVEQCGRYGAIDLVSRPPFWAQIDPTSTTPFITSRGTSLGQFLAYMADDTFGFGAPAVCTAGVPTPNLGDWSFTIAELLYTTYGLTHAAMTRAGASGGRRGTLAFFSNRPSFDWQTGEPLVSPFLVMSHGGKPPGDIKDLSVKEGVRGISLIHGVLEMGSRDEIAPKVPGQGLPLR